MNYKITPREKGAATVKVTEKTNYFKFYDYDKDGGDAGCKEKIKHGKHGWTAANFKLFSNTHRKKKARRADEPFTSKGKRR